MPLARASGNRREIEGYLIASKETDLDDWLGSVLALSLSLRSSASAEQIMSHFHIKGVNFSNTEAARGVG